jgi:hypothetical protein
MRSIVRVLAIALLFAIPQFASAALPKNANPTPSPSPVPNSKQNPAANTGVPSIVGIPLARPEGLRMATSGQDCASKMTLDSQASKCDPGFAAHHLILIWSYNGNNCPAKPNCVANDGFIILKGGALVAKQSADPAQTAIVLGESISDEYGKCYTVEAYKGATQTGPESSPFCVPMPPMILSPKHSNPSVAIDTGGSDGCGGGFYVGNANSANLDKNGSPIAKGGQIIAGYSNANNSQGCGNNRSRTRYRSGLYFELPDVSPSKLKKATLSLTVEHGWVDALTGDANMGNNGNPNEKSLGESCARTLGYASSDDWEHSVSRTKLIGYESAIALGGETGALSVDVSKMVKAWLAGTHQNHGFVLASEEKGGTNNLECLTIYGAPKLTLEQL